MPQIGPDDVRLAAREVKVVLESRLDGDWSARAGRLDWSVQETVAHTVGSVAKYALYLARRSTRFIAVGVRTWPDASPADHVDAVLGVSETLANVAEMSPPDARGYHNAGMLDAEGFCALALIELLVHGHDAAEGLEAEFAPPLPLVERLVARVFPWLAPEGDDRWQLMLWHTGRIELPGRESHSDDSWSAVLTPLSEWDGTIPRPHARPVVEWVGNEPGTWAPVFLDPE